MSPFAEHVMNGKHLRNPRFLSLVISTDHSEREGSLYPPEVNGAPTCRFSKALDQDLAHSLLLSPPVSPHPCRSHIDRRWPSLKFFRNTFTLLFLLPQTLFPLLQLGNVNSECLHGTSWGPGPPRCLYIDQFVSYPQQ